MTAPPASAPTDPSPPDATPADAPDATPGRLGRIWVAMAVFVVCVCAAMLALDVALALRARQVELRQADVATGNLARAVSQQTDAMMLEVEHVLDQIVYELQRQDIAPETYDRLQPLLVIQASNLPQVHDLFVYDARGGWQVSSRPLPAGRLDNSDRPYFIHHRDNPSQRMHVGMPIVSRSSGVWVLPLSRRIDDAEGRFAGVVLATVEVDYLLQKLSGFDIGREGAIGLFSSAGQLLVRRPYAEQDLGRSIAGTPIHDATLRDRAGSTVQLSPIDSVLRRISYQQLEHQPAYVTVALSEHELLTEWRRATRVQTIGIVLLCALVAGAGAFLVQAIRQRGRMEARLYRAQRALQDANVRLRHLAQHDGLTQLLNRRSFDEHLAVAAAQAARSGQPVAVVMMDVDHFKRYNDRYGHPAGDRCLQAVARAVESAARRPGDLVARYGGEELVALLPNTDATGAWIVAEAMRQAVRGLGIAHEDNAAAGRVTMSVGVAAQVPGHGAHDTAELLRHADAALYRAKATGRDQVCVHRAA